MNSTINQHKLKKKKKGILETAENNKHMTAHILNQSNLKRSLKKWKIHFSDSINKACINFAWLFHCLYKTFLLFCPPSGCQIHQ